MKNNKINFPFLRFSLIPLMISGFFITSYAQERNTVWIRGVSINSNGWEEVKSEMILRGYDFNDLMNTSFDPSLGVVAAADQVEGMIGNEGDVLGIAHDYGGIVLRDLQLQDPSITAMILDGVPNQGSSGILGAIQNDGPNSLSRAQKLVQAVNLIREGDDCNNCGFIEAFESWIDEMEGAEDFLNDVQQGSPIIENLNSPANLPSVPFAILWGSVDELSLTSLMSSRAFPSDSDYFTECFTETLYRERQEAKDATVIATINNTQGFFGNLLSAAASIIPAAAADPTQVTGIIASIGSLLSDSRDRITNQIQAIKQENAELARILRCELSNQLLAAEWQLLLMSNSALEEVEVEVQIFGDDYDECITQCGVDMAWGDWDMDLTCEEFCADEVEIGTEIITVFVADPNDGLLTRSEQQLDGAAAEPFHLIETNHFQETSRLKDVVNDAFVDLFEGGAGAAFIVPK
ncbi:MAG: hypothetical protein AAFZ15_22580 [Bacteroidota bacterium]